MCKISRLLVGCAVFAINFLIGWILATFKTKIILIFRITKRGDQVLISISTILKFSAQVLDCEVKINHTSLKGLENIEKKGGGGRMLRLGREGEWCYGRKGEGGGEIYGCGMRGRVQGLILLFDFSVLQFSSLLCYSESKHSIRTLYTIYTTHFTSLKTLFSSLIYFIKDNFNVITFIYITLFLIFNLQKSSVKL